MDDWQGIRIYTIGHSTRPLAEFLSLLESAGVDILADIRTVPRSRHNPWFDGDVLPDALERHGIEYLHLANLGGLRHTHKGSPNTGWHNASFRGFADYMQTAPFVEGLHTLHALTSRGTVALMCAEAVPWRCHRSLVADALSIRGAIPLHIMGPGTLRPHRVTPFASVHGESLTYPG